MSGPAEATVTTLLAEVKTLMIGTRQVTLSVFSQLDRIADDLIIPFGRVSPPGNQEAVVWVAGRHKDNGTLVRSSLPLGYAGREDYVRKALGGEFRGLPASWRADTLIREQVREKMEARDKLKKEIQQDLDEKVAEWQSLDLIVLAGLGLR